MGRKGHPTFFKFQENLYVNFEQRLSPILWERINHSLDMWPLKFKLEMIQVKRQQTLKII